MMSPRRLSCWAGVKRLSSHGIVRRTTLDRPGPLGSPGTPTPRPAMSGAPMSYRFEVANYLPYLVNRLGLALKNFTATAVVKRTLRRNVGEYGGTLSGNEISI